MNDLWDVRPCITCGQDIRESMGTTLIRDMLWMFEAPDPTSCYEEAQTPRLPREWCGICATKNVWKYEDSPKLHPTYVGIDSSGVWGFVYWI